MNRDPEAPVAPRRARGWLGAVQVYGQPRMLSMLALGFSSGLPFMLIYSTLSAWLRQSGIERATIGMLSWVSLVYTLKFLWAPAMDHAAPPFGLARFGRRRGWLLAVQPLLDRAERRFGSSTAAGRAALDRPRRPLERHLMRGWHSGPTNDEHRRRWLMDQNNSRG